MTAKITTARRKAFLKALGETGNLTLSAERAKVSRNWAMYLRRREPGFDEQCRAAIASFGKLRMSGENNKPPSGWGYLDGEELVVRGLGGRAFGRRVQIARARLKQWTPRVEDRFLAALAATCNVKAACAQAGMTAASAYNHRKRWPGFARRWDEGIGDGYLRIEMGLIENGQNLFSAPDLPPDVPMTGMTAAQAIHILHMHKHQVRGIGKAPGTGWRRPPSMDDPAIRASIIATFEMAARRRRMSEVEQAEQARAEGEWTRRRRA